MTIETISATKEHPPLSETAVYRLSLGEWCHGLGIEIGALHNPQRGLPADANVLYVDKASTRQLIEWFQSDASVPKESIAPVDIVGDAPCLPIRGGALDFLIAHNVLEHLPNPVATLREWYRTLKEGGRLYISIPDKRFCFDSERWLTSWDHLAADLDRNDNGLTDASREHLREWVRFIERAAPDQIEARVDLHMSTVPDYHYHTWTHETLLLTLHRCGIEFGLGFRRVAELSSYETAGETLLVLEKDSSQRTLLPAPYRFTEWRVDRMEFALDELLPSTLWEQSFTCSRDGLTAVHVRFGTFGRTNSGEVMFRLYRESSGVPEVETKLDISGLFDNCFHAFVFSPLSDSAGQRFRFTLQATNTSTGNAVTAWCARLSRPGLRFAVNGNAQRDAALNFKAVCVATLPEDGLWQESRVEPYINSAASPRRLMGRLWDRLRRS